MASNVQCLLRSPLIFPSSVSLRGSYKKSDATLHKHKFCNCFGNSQNLRYCVGRKENPEKTLASISAVMATSNENPALVAKEMERVAAKEALLLAIKDAGGVEALSTGNGNSAGKIEVSEKVLALERLNPTPRPTTSPLLEGEWEFVWAGANSPALRLAKILLMRFPQQLATLDTITLTILQGSTIAIASLKLFSTVETTFTLTTKIYAEGPIRLKEEYQEGVLAPPVVSEGTLPSSVRQFIDRLASVSQNLPETVKETLAGGLKLPLGGTFSRQILISYLDDEIMVARDQTGIPDVLVRVVTQVPGVVGFEYSPDPTDYNS